MTTKVISVSVDEQFAADLGFIVEYFKTNYTVDIPTSRLLKKGVSLLKASIEKKEQEAKIIN
jgi:hypothetical protein